MPRSCTMSRIIRCFNFSLAINSHSFKHAVWSRLCFNSAKRILCSKRFKRFRTSAKCRWIPWIALRHLLPISIVEDGMQFCLKWLSLNFQEINWRTCMSRFVFSNWTFNLWGDTEVLWFFLWFYFCWLSRLYWRWLNCVSWILHVRFWGKLRQWV